MLSEALHYSVKLLICTLGIPAPLFIVDTGGKNGEENVLFCLYCRAGFRSRSCRACHNSTFKRGKNLIYDFQIQSRNAVKSMLAQAYAITFRKSSFTY